LERIYFKRKLEKFHSIYKDFYYIRYNWEHSKLKVDNFKICRKIITLSEKSAPPSKHIIKIITKKKIADGSSETIA